MIEFKILKATTFYQSKMVLFLFSDLLKCTNPIILLNHFDECYATVTNFLLISFLYVLRCLNLLRHAIILT